MLFLKLTRSEAFAMVFYNVPHCEVSRVEVVGVIDRRRMIT